jgi:hypothetical protein
MFLPTQFIFHGSLMLARQDSPHVDACKVQQLHSYEIGRETNGIVDFGASASM